MKPLSEQLTSAKRELALRRNAYPKWVANGRMSQAAADHEIECMEAVVESIQKLKWLEEVSEEMRCRA